MYLININEFHRDKERVGRRKGWIIFCASIGTLNLKFKINVKHILSQPDGNFDLNMCY